MKFGSVAIEAAVGGLVAHTVRAGALVLRKGEIVREEHLPQLRAARIDEIVLARLEAGDVSENMAAEALARRIAGLNIRVEAPFTGRSNLFSTTAGVLVVNVPRLDGVNQADESITVATLPPYRSVSVGEMIATVKIIPFAIPEEILARAEVAAATPVIEVRPYRRLSVGVVSTLLPSLKTSVIEKTLRALAHRLEPTGARIAHDVRTPHESDALAAVIRKLTPDCDLIVIFGASAITDRRDVIPRAVESAGGRIERLGMPVDPGNLLLLASTAEHRPLLGAPGCARSPKENGFDWVLRRLIAGIEVRSADVVAMGAGGLLMEIVSRPQPRADESSTIDSFIERLEADD